VGANPGTLRRLRGLAVLFVAAALATGCGTNDPAPASDVDAAAALIAVVEWQIGDGEAVVDDAGVVLLPVIYLAAGDGGTFDVGVQAAVASAVAEVAVVRFTDDVADAFDSSVEGEPVIGDGVMLLIGAIPEPARVIVLPLERFTSSDTSEALELEITTDRQPSGLGPATVTAVTRP